MLGINPGPTASSLINSHPHSEGLFRRYAGPPAVSDLPLAQVSCFCGFPRHGFDPFVHIITPPSLQLDSGSLVQWLVVNLCICFHQLLDEGSMIIQVAINLITEEGQFRHPLHHCLEF